MISQFVKFLFAKTSENALALIVLLVSYLTPVQRAQLIVGLVGLHQVDEVLIEPLLAVLNPIAADPKPTQETSQ